LLPRRCGCAVSGKNTYLCGMNIEDWRPWGKAIRINLDSGLSDYNRVLIGRTFNDKGNGTHMLLGFIDHKLGSFSITRK